MRCVRYPYFVSVVAGMGVVVGASVVVTTQDGGVHTELLSSPVNPKTWKKNSNSVHISVSQIMRVATAKKKTSFVENF